MCNHIVNIYNILSQHELIKLWRKLRINTAHFIIIIYQWGIEVHSNSKPGGGA